MNKCAGLPGWECGRTLSGDGYCIVHGDAETRADRWEAHRAPMPVGKQVRLPVADPRQLAMEDDAYEHKKPGRLTRAAGLASMRAALDSPRWWTVAELAKHMSINIKATQRWLASMEGAGCPLEIQRADDLDNYRYRRMQA